MVYASDYGVLPELSRYALSPDGRWLAVYRGKHGLSSGMVTVFSTAIHVFSTTDDTLLFDPRGKMNMVLFTVLLVIVFIGWTTLICCTLWN